MKKTVCIMYHPDQYSMDVTAIQPSFSSDPKGALTPLRPIEPTVPSSWVGRTLSSSNLI